ncbi:MAG: RluA family pseudouridine synthase [Candidatus Omnitrophota bacterium]|jgi:23S rRNA pseudouridine1911/1915/1917 synthase
MEQTINVEAKHQGERLDKFLQQNISSLSRTRVNTLVKEEKILVNGKVKKPSYRLKENDSVVVKVEEKQKDLLKPYEFKVNIIYEDEDLLVIDKPGGLTVHPPHICADNTLVNALVYMKKELSDINAYRPGVVHRLDKETSGVMVLAKNNASHLKLIEQFASRKIKKEYFAIVWGVVAKDHMVADLPISRDAKNRLKMKVSFVQSKNAFTEGDVKERLPDSTFLSLKPRTGRMHQIRVHLKFLGFPIVGDKKYGIKDSYDELFLHAHKLGLYHPKSEKIMEFVSPVPKRFTEFIEKHRKINENRLGVGDN